MVLSLTLPLLSILLYADTVNVTEKENIWTQPYLFGDGKGIGKKLADDGIEYNFEYTSIYQGLDTELFYNVEVTPWLHITADVQYVNPADTSYDADVVVGIRSNIRF